MVIRVIGKKYPCGSNYGITYLDADQMLEKLNSIIEWSSSGFPFELKEGGSPFNKEDYVENRKYLGDEPKLKPGDCFVWDSQEFAIDSEKRLVLLNTETGWMAIKRFWEEVVESELELWKDWGSSQVDVDVVPEIPKSEETGELLFPAKYTPPFALMKTWKEKFIRGRYDKDDILVLTIVSENYLLPPVIYVKNWDVYYDGEWINEDMIDMVVKDAFSCLYRNSERLKVEEEKEKEDGGETIENLEK